MTVVFSAKAEKIRDLNDCFRTTFSGGRIVTTKSVDELPACVKAEAFLRVASYSDFHEENDPHGEHDFGSFELVSRKFFWKIDYYDNELVGGSDDPSDPTKTVRVLTVMLAEDY